MSIILKPLMKRIIDFFFTILCFQFQKTGVCQKKLTLGKTFKNKQLSYFVLFTADLLAITPHLIGNKNDASIFISFNHFESLRFCAFDEMS